MLDRRQFVAATAAALGTLSGACGGMTDVAGGATTGAGPHTIPLPAVGATVAIDGVGLGGQGVAVTRLGASSVVAVSRQCTHQNCTVGLPSAPGQNLVCPCHLSAFTSSGAVVNGPAAAPLMTYPATIDVATNTVVVTIT